MDLSRLDATAQAELVRTAELSPVELVDAAIERIERLNPRINAVITDRFERARREASSCLAAGPFRGVPFLLKDLFLQSAGDPFHAGMRVLKDLGWTSDHDSHLARKFRDAGFVFLGKTNVPELGPMTTTEPEAYGPSRNPWDPSRSTGGSSGGAAAAVASGMVPAAHASDGGGSIRIPASECGLVGLKPSRGRVSLGPDAGESWNGLTVEHVLTRSVRDTAAILDATAGPMPGDPYTAPTPARPFLSEAGTHPGRLRIGLLSRAPGGRIAVHPDCAAAVADAAKLLESLGHSVEESHPAALDEADAGRWIWKLITAWTAWDLRDWSRKVGRPLGREDVELYTWALGEAGRSVTTADFQDALIGLQAFTRRIADWWAGGFDLLLTPTLAEPPPLLGTFRATADDPLAPAFRMAPFATFNSPFNATGQPAVSLPLFWNGEGLPIGIQLVAAYGREDLLVRIAAQLEEARPWSDRRPRIHA